MNNRNPGDDATNRDMNRDPITGAPGSHPVGSGAGAAVGATVGGVVGAIGGPVGVVAGAAIGGVAGGLVGKTTAEAINPTGEVEYWRSQYATRPYARGFDFADYEPAYFGAATAYPAFAGRRFEEVEPELERNWKTDRRGSRLEWNQARHASKDAWERIAATHKNAPKSEHEAAEDVNSLIEFLYDGSRGFREASEKVENPAMKAGLAQFAQQRESFIAELKPLVAARGETPEKSGTIAGALHRGWIGLKSALTSGDKAILSECERGEDVAVAKYKKLMDNRDLTPQLRSVVQKQYPQVQQAHDTVKQWRDSLK